jgi:RNA polymerase sigma-32 factor
MIDSSARHGTRPIRQSFQVKVREQVGSGAAVIGDRCSSKARRNSAAHFVGDAHARIGVTGLLARGGIEKAEGVAALAPAEVVSVRRWRLSPVERRGLMTGFAGVAQQFLSAAMTAPFLGREEEHALASSWREQGDERAMHKLARAHMRLVIALAVRLRHYGLPVADLIQEGHVGLLEAAARFDPDREVRFSTYATWWIRASMQDYILRNWSIVRGGTSSAQKALFFNLRRVRARVARDGASRDSSEMIGEIASALGVARADVEMMDARLSGPDISLNAPRSDDDTNTSDRLELLVDDRPLPDETVGLAIDTMRHVDWLNEALESLSAREQRILRERRLVDEAATLEALGDRLGISKERVRQIESRALEKLRAALAKRHMDRDRVLEAAP